MTVILPGIRIDSLKENNMRSSLIIILFTLLPLSEVFAQGPPERFWDNVEFNIGVGVNNFHGDYDALNGSTFDYQGVPYPFEGVNAEFSAAKPLGVISNPNMNFKTFLGLGLFRHRSATISSVNDIPTTAELIPVNLINTAFGVNLGLSFEYLITDNFSIEPNVEFSYKLHDPSTDGIMNPSAEIVTNSLPETGGSPPYSLSDFQLTRNATESISPGVPTASGAVKFNKTFLGNYTWFFKYRYSYFLTDMFDNTSIEAASGKGEEFNDSMTFFTLGVTYPLDKEKRRTQEVTKQRVRIDRERIAKIERIQNIANLVTTEEDLRELRRIMSDKILLYDTPGVRFNELAAKAKNRKIALGDSEILSDMIEVPGGSFIMGLTSVDELNIQVQGRKRITINPFLIDKYEVSNRQYRAFLIAMGAIDQPVSVDPADTTVANYNYGSGMDMDELLRKADLSDYRQHVNPPELDSPDDLLPDSTQWEKMGLDDVVPWDTYFYDTYYDNYPVVCVNWYQAKMFAAWAGKRLPTESEWEYAARSGISGRVYPWDGLEVQTKTGKYRANFKQDRGVYQADGYAIMAPVESFVPNDFGAYNFAGNVSEWVFDSYNPSYVVLQNVGTSNFVSPSYNNMQEPRKVHRGGSWQSTKFFIGVGVRNFQDKNLGTPFVGFRCAKSIARRYR